MGTERSKSKSTNALSVRRTLARIIRMVEEAQSRQRAPIRTVGSTVSHGCIRSSHPRRGDLDCHRAAIVIWICDSGERFYRALVLLVIGRPCALVISTPVGILASLAAAARPECW